MADNANVDIAYIAAMAAIAAVAVAVLIRLLPVLLSVLWQAMPTVAIMVVIFGVLRGMIAKFLDT